MEWISFLFYNTESNQEKCGETRTQSHTQGSRKKAYTKCKIDKCLLSIRKLMRTCFMSFWNLSSCQKNLLVLVGITSHFKLFGQRCTHFLWRKWLFLSAEIDVWRSLKYFLAAVWVWLKVCMNFYFHSQFVLVLFSFKLVWMNEIKIKPLRCLDYHFYW